MNVADQDQMDAAVRDTRHTLLSYAEEKGTPVSEPGPLTRALMDAFTHSVRPGIPVRACIHAATSTVPVFGRAHRPAELLCHRCLQVAALIPDPVEDYRCDVCRRICDDVVYQVAAVVGPLTLLGGMCTGCHQKDEAGR